MSSRTVLVCICLAVAACSGLEPLNETTTVDIQFESVDLPGRLWDPFMPPVSTGEPVTIDARLTIPATSEQVPAVIIVHGCGGVGAAERGWVDDLVDNGYATLIVDSFGNRGVGNVCFGRETVNVASLVVDVYRAVDALSENGYVDAGRLAVMGFSFGGRTAIWSAMTRFQEAYDGRPLSAHIAFYPSTCFIELDDETWGESGPLRIFHGTDDDYTPIDQCLELVDRIAGEGVDARLLPYEGALHSFDNETLTPGAVNRLEAPSPRNCRFVEIDGEIIDPDTGDVAGVGSPCVELGVTYGYNPSSHEAARADLLDFLDMALVNEPG